MPTRSIHRKKPARTKRMPAFPLSDVERILLVLYRTVPVADRADVGRQLFWAWTHASEADKDANEYRRKLASARFKTADQDISVFDDLQAAEVMAEAGGGR